MMKRSRFGLVVVSLLLCPLLFSGCRLFGSGGGNSRDDDSDVLNLDGTALANEDAMGEYREGLGHRVQNLTLDVIYFGYDSFQVESAQAAYLRDNPGAKLVVEGHSDERGSREYNLSLGEHRALAIRAYLIGLGIEPSRIQTRSYGEEAPASAGHNDSAWQANRRGEFAVYE